MTRRTFKSTESRFKAANGKYYTKQLFWEMWITLDHHLRIMDPLFTLHKDKEGLINFGKRYVELGDPTGYKISKELLESYDHWNALMTVSWFRSAKEMWDRELDAKLAAEAMEKINELLHTGLPAQQLAAAKYLANKEYRKDKSTSKGRPKAEDVARAARDMAATDREIENDLQRIMGARN